MPQVDRATLEKLSSQDWKALYPQLTHYALLLVKSLRWQTGSTDLPKGFQAQDLVNEAITLVFTGQRRWNPGKVPVLIYLKGVIRSLASHLVESAEHKKRQDLTVVDEETETIKEVEISDTNAPSPEDLLLVNEIAEYLLKSAKGDENMQLVLLCLDDGMKRSEIVELTELPLKEVDNIMKRIRRALKKFLENN